MAASANRHEAAFVLDPAKDIKIPSQRPTKTEHKTHHETVSHHSRDVLRCCEFYFTRSGFTARIEVSEGQSHVGYEVVQEWPQRPADIKLRYVTGLAVDKQDNVWTLNALSPQVQVQVSGVEHRKVIKELLT